MAGEQALALFRDIGGGNVGFREKSAAPLFLI
jgi:hypothetical protein